jgi:hypothetical protein
MSNWSDIDVAANAVMQQEFGEPVVYQPVQAGTALGDPLTITAVRHARVREESGALANFEEISMSPPDLPNPPVKGDWVTAWGAQYTVSTVRQPDAYGMIALTLLQRAL